MAFREFHPYAKRIIFIVNGLAILDRFERLWRQTTPYLDFNSAWLSNKVIIIVSPQHHNQLHNNSLTIIQFNLLLIISDRKSSIILYRFLTVFRYETNFFWYYPMLALQILSIKRNSANWFIKFLSPFLCCAIFSFTLTEFFRLLLGLKCLLFLRFFKNYWLFQTIFLYFHFF